MLTKNDFCDYDTCVALKELGYNRGAYAYYFPNHKEDLIFNTHQMRGCSINEMLKGYNTYPKDVMGCEFIDAPTMWEAQKWLREEKDIDVLIKLECKDVYSSLKHYSVYLSYIGSFIRRFQYLLDEFNSYEEALFEGIKIAVKILKEKLNEET